PLTSGVFMLVPELTGISLPEPDNNSRTCCSNCFLETAYIPPRAPSNWQFHAASAWPKRIASAICRSVDLLNPAKPAGAIFERSPAVHQSPEPAVSRTASTDNDLDSTQVPIRRPEGRQR